MLEQILLQPKLYKISADATVFIHLLWILFLIFGAIPGHKVRWIRNLHISALVFSILSQINSWICPITYLEIWLRSKAGLTYSGGFIQHYIEKLVYLDVSRMAVFIGLFVVIVGSGLLYWRGRNHI